MRKLLFAAIAALFLTACNVQQEPNWTYLFNGYDLTGWTRAVGEAEFVVEDGVIIGTARRGTTNAFLRTDQEFDNFILEFEFKVTDGLNSGIQIRSHQQAGGRRLVYGYQWEIDPLERAWTGGIFDEARRGWLYPLTFNQPARAAFRGEGEWNSGRIEAIGHSIRGWLNGVPSCDLWCDMTPKGFIALQVHGSNMREDGATASFRNIRILTEDLEKWATPNYGEIPHINAINNTLSPIEIENGWQLLWDGRTTNGWNNAYGWTIENGTLIVERVEGEHLVTDREFENFWLSVDFRVTPGASSGIFYLVDENMDGLEFQTIDNIHNPLAVGKRRLGALFDLVAAPEDKTSAPNMRWDDFNTAWIKVNGNYIEHWLNGLKLLSIERNNDAWNNLVRENMPDAAPGFGNQASGRVFLQHSGSRFYFRNIKIKELP